MGALKSCRVCPSLRRLSVKSIRGWEYYYKCRMLTVNNSIAVLDGTPEWCPLLFTKNKEDERNGETLE
jgi:hypothetical protein